MWFDDEQWSITCGTAYGYKGSVASTTSANRGKYGNRLQTGKRIVTGHQPSDDQARIITHCSTINWSTTFAILIVLHKILQDY